MIPVLEPPVTRWHCPDCRLTDVTRVAGPHSRMHSCTGLAGLTVPMVVRGEHVLRTVHEREDYIGDEDVQFDDRGRPVMSVTTERHDGSNDVVVFAPTARARVS